MPFLGFKRLWSERAPTARLRKFCVQLAVIELGTLRQGYEPILALRACVEAAWAAKREAEEDYGR